MIGFPGLLLYGLGSTVGAGIYVLIGVVAGRAGTMAPLAFVVAALLATPTALSFAALSARFPFAGGALVFVREGFGRPRLAFAVGLGAAFAGMVSAATVSRGFVAYLGELIDWPPMLVLAAVVGGVGALAAWGIRESITAAALVTLVEVAGLLAVIAVGAARLASDGALVAAPDPLPDGSLIAIVGPVLASAVLCFYAFLGFEDIVNVAEEVRDVRRVMPRAIAVTLVVSTSLYAAVAMIAVRLVPAETLGGSESPLALVVEHAGLPSQWISAIALVAMLNGALVQVVMAARVLFSLARSGELPARLGRVHPRRRTPVFATAVVTGGILVLAVALPLERLAALTASVALAVFVLVNVAALRVLRRERAAGGPVHGDWPQLPLFVPVLGALGSAAFLVIEWVARPLGLG